MTSVAVSSVQLVADGAFGSATAMTAVTSPTFPGVERPARRAGIRVAVGLQHLAGRGDLELEVGLVDGDGRQVGLPAHQQPVAGPAQGELHPLTSRPRSCRKPAELVEREAGEAQQRPGVALLAVGGDVDVVGDLLRHADRGSRVVRAGLRGRDHDLAVDGVVGLDGQRGADAGAAAQRGEHDQQGERQGEGAARCAVLDPTRGGRHGRSPGWTRRGRIDYRRGEAGRHGAIVPTGAPTAPHRAPLPCGYQSSPFRRR